MIWFCGSWRARTVGSDPSLSGVACGAAAGAVPVPVVGVGEHEVGAIHLVAGGAEIIRDRAEVGAAGDAVLHEPGGLGPGRRSYRSGRGCGAGS